MKIFLGIVSDDIAWSVTCLVSLLLLLASYMSLSSIGVECLLMKFARKYQHGIALALYIWAILTFICLFIKDLLSHYVFASALSFLPPLFPCFYQNLSNFMSLPTLNRFWQFKFPLKDFIPYVVQCHGHLPIEFIMGYPYAKVCEKDMAFADFISLQQIYGFYYIKLRYKTLTSWVCNTMAYHCRPGLTHWPLGDPNVNLKM